MATKTKSEPATKVANRDGIGLDEGLEHVFRVTSKTSEEDVLRYAQQPGVTLAFNEVDLKVLRDDFVALLPASAQKAYWLAFSGYNERKIKANNAVFEIGIDPARKLLDGSGGMSNPLIKDLERVKDRLPGYFFTWRVQGGEGDLEDALRNGFKIVRRPKNEAEEQAKTPLEWSGEVWKIRDGTVDHTSGDEIFNVMVVIREQAWKDHLAAVSMISHNKYELNKKMFMEGMDNLNKDMLSAKERVEVIDLDERHVEEHTVVENGKRVHMGA